ncbi:hypothetical protein [Methanobrevibacter filiformis]|uniref:hypothetical protein n=1 Tax=Methanobrevibacter filiformis TaxID=55758 RepID=UPI0012EDBE4A|nr:hypothetical protein [Methanobrevibacter filiformis]
MENRVYNESKIVLSIYILLVLLVITGYLLIIYYYNHLSVYFLIVISIIVFLILLKLIPNLFSAYYIKINNDSFEFKSKFNKKVTYFSQLRDLSIEKNFSVLELVYVGKVKSEKISLKLFSKEDRETIYSNMDSIMENKLHDLSGIDLRNSTSGK